MSCLRATSTKTRIETAIEEYFLDDLSRVSEQHPRKQGLKHPYRQVPGRTGGVSEQHPRKQGLKPVPGHHDRHAVSRLRATSTKTRIETYLSTAPENATCWSQSNIHENKD